MPIFIALHSDQFFLNLYSKMLEEKGRERTGKDVVFIDAKSDLLIGNTSFVLFCFLELKYYKSLSEITSYFVHFKTPPRYVISLCMKHLIFFKCYIIKLTLVQWLHIRKFSCLDPSLEIFCKSICNFIKFRIKYNSCMATIFKRQGLFCTKVR